MIHDWDTHFWIAKTPGGVISAEEHSSAEPLFQSATTIRIEPLSSQSIQAVLDCEVPEGYTAFLRTDLHRDLSGNLIMLGYVVAVERGEWPDPGRAEIGGFAIDRERQAGQWAGIPIKDGYRAELCTWNGEVAFEASEDFTSIIKFDDHLDVYKFVRK